MKKIQQIAAAAALVASTMAASAADTSWAAHEPVEFGFGYGIGGGANLFDTYSFSLAAASTLTTTAVSSESSALDLSGAVVSLFQGTVGSGSFVSAFGFDSNAITASITPLTAGLYYYLVTGSVGANAIAGSYTLTSQATPVLAVPEPESVALMLAGLLAVGFMAARRRSDL